MGAPSWPGWRLRTCLGHHGLTLINVMVVALAREVQPLQQRIHPMWDYNRTDDSTRAIWARFHNHQALGVVLKSIFKDEKADLVKEPMYDGFASYKPVEAVSYAI